MTGDQLDAMTRALSRVKSRRPLLAGIAGASLGLGVSALPEITTAKKKRHKHKKRETPPPAAPLCTRSGKRCDTAGADCQPSYCLKPPFSIAAVWATIDADHDTVLYVPAGDATTGPFPYVYYGCNPGNSFCVEAYPFACVDRDATGPGNEITTIYRLLPGRYEYWIQLEKKVPAGDLLVTLSDGSGRVVREWSSPANATNDQVEWHVFDIDPDASIVSIDALPHDGFPAGDTDICPYLD